MHDPTDLLVTMDNSYDGAKNCKLIPHYLGKTFGTENIDLRRKDSLEIITNSARLADKTRK